MYMQYVVLFVYLDVCISISKYCVYDSDRGLNLVGIKIHIKVWIWALVNHESCRVLAIFTLFWKGHQCIFRGSAVVSAAIPSVSCVMPALELCSPICASLPDWHACD